MLGAMGPLPREVDATLKIDGIPPTTGPLRVRELIHDGALSEAFLRAWVWTFQIASAEVWAAPVTKAPSAPEAKPDSRRSPLR